MAIACATRHRRSLRPGTRRSLDRIGADGKGPQVEIAARLRRTPTGVLALDCHWTRPWWADPRPVTNPGGITSDPLGFYHKAEVLEYSGGMPGDIGFFLYWQYDTFRAIPEKWPNMRADVKGGSDDRCQE